MVTTGLYCPFRDCIFVFCFWSFFFFGNPLCLTSLIFLKFMYNYMSLSFLERRYIILVLQYILFLQRALNFCSIVFTVRVDFLVYIHLL